MTNNNKENGISKKGRTPNQTVTSCFPKLEGDLK